MYKYLTFLGVLVIENHPKLFKKREKSPKKKSSDFFKIKILLGNSYARITKNLKILKNLNFFSIKRDITADLYFTINSYQHETIFF